MSLSVKLSSSAIRPFGFSFGRPHNGLCSYPIVATHHQCLHHQQQKQFSSEPICRRLGNASSSHMSLITRPISNVNNPNTEPLRPVKEESSESVLLSKETSSGPNDTGKDPSKPTAEQLLLINNRMKNNLPNFFTAPHDFGMYNKGVLFEDNIRNVRTTGINAYVWQLTKVKMGAHFKYGKVNLQVLKITSHIEDGTIRVRWRIVSVPGNNIFIYLNFKAWSSKESIDKFQNEWIDGFSIFQVGGDGTIHKHTCDKVIPDTDKVKAEKVNLAVKLAIALGIVPGEQLGENLLSAILTWIDRFM